MYATNRYQHLRALGVAIGLAGLVLAGCGGGSKSGSSSTGPTSSGAVRVEGRVVSVSRAMGSGGPVLTWIEAVLSPREAEAQGVPNCTVSAGGVTGVTDGNGRFILTNVPTNAGAVTLTFSCPPNVTGTLTLGNLPPNSTVTLEVDVRPGEVRVRTRNVQPSAPSPSASQPSPPSAPSPPSPPSPSGNSGPGSRRRS